MSEHTPGPCHVHEREDDGFPSAGPWPEGWEPTFLVEFGKEDTDYGGFMVCGFHGYGPEYHPVRWRRLIAAAPELLEACKWALAALYDHGEDPVMLRAAIAKAQS